MKTILSLGFFFVALISYQVYLERQNYHAPEGTDTEIDSVHTRYKILNGKLYFLSNDRTWEERNEYVWLGSDGYYYVHEDGKLYSSQDGSSWSQYVALH